MGSPTSAIYRWGYNTVRVVFFSKRMVDKSNFNLIYRKGMEGVIWKRSSRMFCVFITKHVTGACGINSHLSKIDWTKYKNGCLSCGGSPETSSHIVRCLDKGRTELFHATVDKMLE